MQRERQGHTDCSSKYDQSCPVILDKFAHSCDTALMCEGQEAREVNLKMMEDCLTARCAGK